MRRFAVAITALVVLALTARAQAGDPALAGAVHTEDGTPLAHLVLTLDGPSGRHTVVTGLDGGYRAAGLAPGVYAAALDVPGFLLSGDGRATVGEGEARLDLVVVPAPIREGVVVSATRGDAPASTLGVTATALDRERIEERQAPSFLHLLQDVPGVAVARTGALGHQASAFVRGGESRFARILVDGVPVNEPGGFFSFGSVLPLELERVEVVRGAASSLYGTDALAGVVHLVTRRASPGDGAGIHLEAEGGRFDWRRGLAGTSGRSGRLDWNLGVQRLQTDNEEANSAFESTAGAFSGGARLGDATSLRLVLRGEDSTTGTPGPTAFGRPDLDASFDRTDLTAGLQLRHARGRAAHEVRAGYTRSEQLSLNPLDSGAYTPRFDGREGAFELSDFPDPDGFQNDTERSSLGYQVELQAGSRNLVTAGIDIERETGELGARAGERITPERTNVGLYVQDRVVVADRVYLTLGGRIERNDSYGTRVVPRVAAALRVRGGTDATTLHASGGAGIKEPGFFESFGVSFYAQGNPDLAPERSRTFDVGVEQRLLGGRLRAEATAFHHAYLDQIAYVVLDFTTFQGSYVNLGKTRARGLELSLEAAPVARLTFSADYTYLDGEVLVSGNAFDPVYSEGAALLRRPKHQASFSARFGGERASAGATLVVVGRRADSDFVGLGLTENERYVRLDGRARLRLGGGLEAFVAAENLLDREYHEALGFPAPGRAVRAGLRYRGGHVR